MAPIPSSQASSEAKSGITGPVPAPSAGVVAVMTGSRVCGSGVPSNLTGISAAEAVTNGRLLAPAKTVTLLSGSMRIAISAPTRLSRSARICPEKSPALERPTSALGAVATMVPSGSRTTMSRMRSAVRPLASRSSCVPPTLT